MKATTYTLRRYSDGVAVGRCLLTEDQLAHYKSMAQQPEGVIRLGALPHSYYVLSDEYQSMNEDLGVFIKY